MSILKVSENEFRVIIAANFTPSEEIRTPERLFGRDKNMKIIDRALNSPGRQIFIYGDRGVGKTSLAVTAAYVYTGSATNPYLCALWKNKHLFRRHTGDREAYNQHQVLNDRRQVGG